jgi:predicted GH43/DUF377 family glycosyl hydrolase
LASVLVGSVGCCGGWVPSVKVSLFSDLHCHRSVGRHPGSAGHVVANPLHFKLNARVSRAEAPTIRQALDQLGAKGSVGLGIRDSGFGTRFQLSRERHARQIFRRRRRAHRHRNIGAQFVVPPPYHLGDVARYRALCEERLDLLRRAVERGGVVGLCLCRGGENPVVEMAALQRILMMSISRRTFLRVATAGVAIWQPGNTQSAPPGAKPEALHPFPGLYGVPSWEVGPFVRDDGADFIRPNPASVFHCPVRMSPVHWEDQAILCAAAVVKDNKVFVLYRAEDSSRSQPAAGKYDWGTSRIGIAASEDGRHFKRYPEPVLFPAQDAMKASEWPGGCQDPRLVETRDGTYVMTYTAWDGKFARLASATSRDLFHWKKQGLAFRRQLGGRFSRDFWSKSGSIVCKREGSRFLAEKINGKYWMYFNDSGIMLASSSNLTDWEIVLDAKGSEPLIIAPMRKGPRWFDQECTESGSPAFITPDGIFMIYNGMAPQRPDLALTGRIWSAGQILFDLKDMTKVIGRTDHDFFHPERDYEKQNVTSGKGGANNVTFVSNLVYFGGKWRFYYGCADSCIACAVSTR